MNFCTRIKCRVNWRKTSNSPSWPGNNLVRFLVSSPAVRLPAACELTQDSRTRLRFLLGKTHSTDGIPGEPENIPREFYLGREFFGQFAVRTLARVTRDLQRTKSGGRCLSAL